MDRGTKHVTLEAGGQISGWGNAYIILCSSVGRA